MIEYKVIIPVLFVSGFIIINILQCKIFVKCETRIC